MLKQKCCCVMLCYVMLIYVSAEMIKYIFKWEKTKKKCYVKVVLRYDKLSYVLLSYVEK